MSASGRGVRPILVLLCFAAILAIGGGASFVAVRVVQKLQSLEAWVFALETRLSDFKAASAQADADLGSELKQWQVAAQQEVGARIGEVRAAHSELETRITQMQAQSVPQIAPLEAKLRDLDDAVQKLAGLDATIREVELATEQSANAQQSLILQQDQNQSARVEKLSFQHSEDMREVRARLNYLETLLRNLRVLMHEDAEEAASGLPQ
jgi:hypothetical protein